MLSSFIESLPDAIIYRRSSWCFFTSIIESLSTLISLHNWKREFGDLFVVYLTGNRSIFLTLCYYATALIALNRDIKYFLENFLYHTYEPWVSRLCRSRLRTCLNIAIMHVHAFNQFCSNTWQCLISNNVMLLRWVKQNFAR